MSTAVVVESPIRDRVSISCTRCTFSHFGIYPQVEPVALAHARDWEHPVSLYLNLVFVGAWMSDGSFETLRGGKPCR